MTAFKFGLRQKVCGTNIVHVIPSKICPGRDKVLSVGYLLPEVSLFRLVVTPYMFQEIIFSKAMPLRILFSYTYSYLELKMRQED